ncbi:MAG: transcriptional regulator NrdR [Zetaproteobacteria bacterium CG12_big_fil_rev_8_21_14_0_65_54_13]|nr:MAG: transcriptional regulator NrdR [Zetaproteobacteria bacterium CG12_big_fil_rev_8_21_14_0_65_54_13]PIX54252.1 MAG: transcriptional regulator NrdR [Zetaproteobacteria bacterium CG_4_10_14_3_um_filter_54_28]PJA27987.1 MAG: transcriptional regulator NrdR [Zetaproteobacteria bacterium CG_4_9_14_3_um_filter_54_145]
MYCPFCANDDTRVVDSRVVEEGAAVRRRRECEACGKRFSTYERAELRLPLVVKKDGTRQSFDLEKIRSGMLKALEKRPVSVVQIEQGLNALVRAVQETGEAEIAADVLGEFVMEQLRSLDGVAYVRFASVYREFKDVEDFLTAVRAAVGKKE